MRLLIIEDNQGLNQEMVMAMEAAGYSVDFSYTGEEGEILVLANSYDAILLDLNLPDRDGMEVLSFIRNEGLKTPVIIISGRDELEDRIEGLDQGADDYLVKPFELAELKARVHALIRRSFGRTQSIMELGSLSIDPLTRDVQWNHVSIPLTAKEFDIIEYLGMSHPHIVSSEKLVEHVYDDSLDPFSSVLRVHIARLRKKLVEGSGTDLLITHRGKGYSLWDENNTNKKS